MSPESRTIILVLLAAAMIAGCLDGARVPSYQAFGSKGSYTSGFAYGGRGVVPFDGPVFLEVDEEANTGFLTAKGRIGPTSFVVTFDQFAQSKSFHDGGIASNLIEHGDSGVGDTSIPRVDLEMVGWGKAQVLYDDKPYHDPVTGNNSWTAHFMVIRNGVRDNATGAIYADANKTEPYDPTKPSNGFSAPGDYEIHLVLRNGTAAASKGGSTSDSVERSAVAPEPDVNEDHVLFKAEKVGSTAMINFTVEDTVTRGSNITFTLKAPSGAVVLEHTMGDAMASPGNRVYVAGFTVNIQEAGDYALTVTGRLNPGGSYEAAYELVPPSAVVLNLWWEDILFGVDALERAAAAGLIGDGTSPTSTATTGTVPPATFDPSRFMS